MLTLITFGLAMMAVPPAGPFCPGDCMTYPFPDILDYYPRDYYWMYLAVFQLFAYVIFMTANHYMAPDSRKVYSFSAIAFALISAIVLLGAYFIQFTVVPISVLKGETEGIALLTQYNGHGIFIALEELGYLCMSISFLFLAFVFSKHSRLEKAIRLLLFLPLIITVLSFIYFSIKFGIDRSYRFEVATISVNWLVTICIGILVAIYINKYLKVQLEGK
jgi:hypothetical protein